MKLVRKIAIFLAIIFVGLLLAFNFYNLFCLKVLNRDLTTISGYAVLEVVSGSMEPTIHVGDLIVIQTKEETYEVGDIITFYDVEGSFVTHRILSIEGSQMITKGDNNNSADSPTNMDAIVGKYVFKITGLGILFKALKSPVVMIIVLFIGIMVCFLVSTDEKGKPLLSKEEEEFQKFLQEKNKNKKIESSNSSSSLEVLKKKILEVLKLTKRKIENFKKIVLEQGKNIKSKVFKNKKKAPRKSVTKDSKTIAQSKSSKNQKTSKDGVPARAKKNSQTSKNAKSKTSKKVDTKKKVSKKKTAKKV